MKRFLLAQFGHFGDCLYATTLAHQIKHDNPDCHLTWAIAPKFQSILIMNPHIDAVLPVPYMYSTIPFDDAWNTFHQEINEHLKYKFDTIIVSQLAKYNCKFYDGTIRSAILNTYCNPITVPVAPVIVLTEDEVKNVASFIKKNCIHSFLNIILFECGPQSGQSSVTLEFSEQIAQSITSQYQDTCFLLSSPSKVKNPTSQIIDASELSFRENAELANHCTLLVGCSSGISWLTTSTWTKKINTVQVINPEYGISTSLVNDAQRFGLPFDHILEIEDKEKGNLSTIIEEIIKTGFEPTRAKYHREIMPNMKVLGSILSGIASTSGHRTLLGTYYKIIKLNKSIPQLSLLFYIVYFRIHTILFACLDCIFPAGTVQRKALKKIKQLILFKAKAKK